MQAGKKFYGSHDDTLMRELAKQAANAGRTPSSSFTNGGRPRCASWAAAKAGGMAVKWTAEGKVAVSALKGQCWSPVDQGRE